MNESRKRADWISDFRYLDPSFDWESKFFLGHKILTHCSSASPLFVHPMKIEKEEEERDTFSLLWSLSLKIKKKRLGAVGKLLLERNGSQSACTLPTYGIAKASWTSQEWKVGQDIKVAGNNYPWTIKYTKCPTIHSNSKTRNYFANVLYIFVQFSMNCLTPGQIVGITISMISITVWATCWK